jgi:hypothetical protein
MRVSIAECGSVRIIAWSRAILQIVNSGIMFVTLSLGGGVTGMGTSEEWARSLGEDLKAKQRVERDIAQTVAMQREIETEKMPLKWDEVLAAFQEHCTVYNEQVKPERTLALFRAGQHDFMVRPDALPEIITGSYDPHTRRIEIRSRVGKDSYFPRVVLAGSGDVELVSLQTKKVKTPTMIARDTLRECLIAP